MLVDLGRNDLGRVCEYGSVRVPQFMTLERYSHVMHLVSIVEGSWPTTPTGSTRWRRAFQPAPCRARPSARDGDHRRARADAARRLRRRGRLSRLCRQPRLLHHHPHRRDGATARPTSRPAPASWRTRIRRRSTRKPRDKAGRWCGPWSWRRRGSRNADADAIADCRLTIAQLRGLSLELQVIRMVFVLDNYDSFTYNLVQYLGELGAELTVQRNDAVTLDEIAALAPESHRDLAGAGTPEEAGMSIDVIRHFGPTIPILGVCLGHQAIGAVFGGSVVRAPAPMHGKTSTIHHDGRGVFSGTAVAVHGDALPFADRRRRRLAVVARGLRAHGDDGIIMGLRHRDCPMQGVQFHPESMLTGEGRQIAAQLPGRDRRGAGAMLLSAHRPAAQTDRHEDLTAEEAAGAMDRVMDGPGHAGPAGRPARRARR